MNFSKFENLLKTISDDSIQHPKGHPSIPGKSQNFHFFQFWPLYVIYIYIIYNVYIYIYFYIDITWPTSKKLIFPELKDDLWDVEYYHHWYFLAGFTAGGWEIASRSKDLQNNQNKIKTNFVSGGDRGWSEPLRQNAKQNNKKTLTCFVIFYIFSKCLLFFADIVFFDIFW